MWLKLLNRIKSNNIYAFRIFEIKEELTARNQNYKRTYERKTLLNKN